MPTLKKEFEDQDVRRPAARRTGLALPMVSNRRGGLKLVSGSENDYKIISLAVMSNASTNAFQQPAVDVETALFELDDITFRALLRRKLEVVFAEFERQHRYRLVPGSMRTERGETGEVFVYFKYHNIEADSSEDISLELGAIA